MPSKLDALVEELREADRRERAELLIDLAGGLPPLPDRLAHFKDEAHRVPECVAQVFLIVEVEGDRVRLFADVPPEAPTTRGFVALLIEGLDGATVADVEAVPTDLVERAGMRENLGMQRLGGFYGIVRRLKAEVVRAARPAAASASH